MKKVIFSSEESKILIEDIDYTHLIVVNKAGNDFGIIVYVNGSWFGKTIHNNTVIRAKVSDVISWFGMNCEFYVLG